MKPQDQALLVVLTVAATLGVGAYHHRRRRGSSRAIATFAATAIAGMVVSVAFVVLFDHLTTARAGIGLERIVIPIVTTFASIIGASLLGGIVYVIESRRPALATQTISVAAEDILRKAARRSPSTRSDPPRDDPTDWRAFARRAAGQDERSGSDA